MSDDSLLARLEASVRLQWLLARARSPLLVRSEREAASRAAEAIRREWST